MEPFLDWMASGILACVSFLNLDGFRGLLPGIHFSWDGFGGLLPGIHFKPALLQCSGLLF